MKNRKAYTILFTFWVYVYAAQIILSFFSSLL